MVVQGSDNNVLTTQTDALHVGVLVCLHARRQSVEGQPVHARQLESCVASVVRRDWCWNGIAIPIGAWGRRHVMMLLDVEHDEKWPSHDHKSPDS